MSHDEEPRRPYHHPYLSPEQHDLEPEPYLSPDDTPTAGLPSMPAASARTVHRLRHIRQVSDTAITVIDQALERAS
ncbi:hypothetical protein [Nonomuraea typhae]|uniref:Uncharacterized protein n=1 Tax=Nonomuraea typhae TaxID=2603600 RepID=A0ABW7YLH5_9ACTN